MLKRLRQCSNNDGFSLIEMIVSILITGIIMLGVGVFISTSRYTYTVVSISSKLQEESTAASNYITELMREAMDFGYQEQMVAGKNYKVIWIQTPTVDDELDMDSRGASTFNFISWVDEDGDGEGKLYYSRTTSSDANMILNNNLVVPGVSTAYKSINLSTINDYIVADKHRLLAEYVKDIYLNPTTQNRVITVKIDYKYFDQDYTSTTAVLSRNLKS